MSNQSTLSLRSVFAPTSTLVFLVCVCLMHSPALFCGEALGGSICGQVQDIQTGDPVALAGIFLRTPSGEYTGDHTATDSQGDYCLENLAAGTYTIEVRVDDYLAAFVNGIVVTDDVSSVPIFANLPPVLLEAPWPNPAFSVVNFRLHVQQRISLEMKIFDARGRTVRAWAASTLEPGPRSYRWDGRNRDGHPAPTGLYLVRIRAGGHMISRPFILTR